MTNEDNSENLERQKFELEKQKLELEKQKLAFEKEKSKEKPTVLPSRKITIGDIVGYVCSLALIVSTFLPWISGKSRGGGFSFSGSINGLEVGHGYIILLCAIAVAVLIALKKVWVVIPAGIALLDSIAVISGIGSFSASVGSASARVGFAIGPVIVLISSCLIFVSTFFLKKSVEGGGGSVNILSFFIKHKFTILLTIAILLILTPLIGGEFELHKFSNLITALFIGCFISAGILFYLKLKRSFLAFIPLIAFYVLGYIFDYNPSFSLGFLGGEDNMSSFSYFSSLAFGSFATWFNIVFYLVFFAILITELFQVKEINIIPEGVGKVVNYFKPKLFYSILFVPLVILLIYNVSTKNLVTEEDRNAFYKSTDQIMGEWYFTDNDSSLVYQLKISTPELTEEDYESEENYESSSLPQFLRDPDYSGELAKKFSFKLSCADAMIVEDRFEYVASYDELFDFPFTVNANFLIRSLSNEELLIETDYVGGNKAEFICVNNYEIINRLCEDKQKLAMELQKKKEKEELMNGYKSCKCDVSNEGDFEITSCVWGIYKFVTENFYDSDDCKFGCKSQFIYKNEGEIHISELFENSAKGMEFLGSKFEQAFNEMSEQDPSCFEETEFQAPMWFEMQFLSDESGLTFTTPLDVPAYCSGPFGESSVFIPYNELISMINLQ